MKVFAVDPGYDRVGFAILEKKDGKEKVLFSECFTTKKEELIQNRIFSIGKRAEEIINNYEPEYFSIEQLFFSKNTKTALQVSEARGAIIYVARTKGLPVYEYTPNQIKLAVTGHGGASKGDVYRMVQRLVLIPGDSNQDDEVDAIATALTFLACYRKG